MLHSRDTVDVEFSLQSRETSTVMVRSPQKSAGGVVIAGLIETATVATCFDQTAKIALLLP
jgi:hypothetical protein